MIRILFWPAFVYYTLTRHELSHALGVVIQGGQLNEVKLLPGHSSELGLYFGYVSHGMDNNWLVSIAPFIIDLISILMGAFAFYHLKERLTYLWLRVLVFFLVLSPVADLIYNYQGGFWRPATDVYKLLSMVSPVLIHVFFITSIATGIYVMNRSQKVLERMKD